MVRRSPRHQGIAWAAPTSMVAEKLLVVCQWGRQVSCGGSRVKGYLVLYGAQWCCLKALCGAHCEGAFADFPTGHYVPLVSIFFRDLTATPTLSNEDKINLSLT